MLYLVLIRAIDRTGLLKDILEIISNLDFNIVHVHGITKEDKAYIIMIVSGYRSSEELKQVKKLSEVEEIDITEVPEYSDIFTELTSLLLDKVSKGELSFTDLIKLTHPEDIPDIIYRLDAESRKRLYKLIPTHYYVEFIHNLPSEYINEIINTIGFENFLEILKKLPIDNLCTVLNKLTPRVRKEILKKLPKELSSEVSKILGYSIESAGSLITTKVPYFKYDCTVGEVIHIISSKGREFDTLNTIYVVNDQGRLVGYVYVKDLLKFKKDEKLENIMKRDIIAVTPDVDQEVVAKLAARYDLIEVPVVDKDGKFLGAITADDLIDVVFHEAAEDYEKLGGLTKPEIYRTWRYVKASVIELYKRRIFWLVLLYIFEAITASILKAHEIMISKFAILAAFIPLLCATGGNAGSQAAALVIRALALGELSVRDFLKIVSKEALTSILLGLTMIPIASSIAYVLTFNLLITIIVSLSVIAAIFVGSIIGGLLPIIATCLKIDPATLAGPFNSVINDILTLSLYLAITMSILGIM